MQPNRDTFNFKILTIHNNFSLSKKKSDIVLETCCADDILKVKEFIDDNRELLLDSIEKKEKYMLNEKRILDAIKQG